MANTITSQVFVDGSRNTVIKWHVSGDGTGDETATAVVDASALTPVPTQLKVMEVEAALVGCSAVLEFDATANQPIISLPEGEDVYDFRDPHGGIPDPLATGTTGDIVITTTGLGAGDSATVIISCKKKALA